MNEPRISAAVSMTRFKDGIDTEITMPVEPCGYMDIDTEDRWIVQWYTADGVSARIEIPHEQLTTWIALMQEIVDAAKENQS